MLQVRILHDTPVMLPLVESDEAKELHIDELIEGAVVAMEGTSVFVNIPGYGTGIIFGREFMSSKDVIKNLNIGDTIKGKVINRENSDGYIELSLKEARQALIWKEADEAIKNKTIFSLPVKSANKGGIILQWQGIEGFLPASQLSTENYPRVQDGDKDQILKELKNLVGKPLSVCIISSNPKEGKLIFSEKGGDVEVKTEIITRYNIGDELDCEVTGAVDFGLFLKIENGLEGLVHISEIDWSLVEDPKKLYKVGDKVRAKVIEIKNGKVSLSIKALRPNPWKEASDKYTKGTEVSGVVIKFNKHGALVAVEEGISGLVHVSDFETEEKLRQTLELGKSYKFKINLFDPQEQRMALSYTGVK